MVSVGKSGSCPHYFRLKWKTLVVICVVVYVSYKLISYNVVGSKEIRQEIKTPNSEHTARLNAEQTTKSNVTNPLNESNVEQLNALWGINPDQYVTGTVFVLIMFTNAERNANLQLTFRTCVTSMSELSSRYIVLLVVSDGKSWDIAVDIVNGLKRKNVEPHQVSLDQIGALLKDSVSTLRQLSPGGPDYYYNHFLFFLSPALHTVTPTSLHRLIVVDADLQFRQDIHLLNEIFDHFGPNQIIGIAYENQPVYRHVLSAYRSTHPGTRAGDPAPMGFPGFNSGILLMDLKGMRASGRYNALLNNATSVLALKKKYSYAGHLGDQDFYTLLGLDHEDLFFPLPCGWNRQLCTWWRDHGYREVFDKYFVCNDTVAIYHGNCNTPFPVE